MRVGFAYNVKHQTGEGLERQLDFDAPETIEAIIKTIEGLGHTVVRIEADEKAFDKLREQKSQIELVFNIAEGLWGDARESQIPLFCEILRIPYTHSSPTTHAVSLNKNLTKLAAAGAGVRVPKSVIVEKPDSVKLWSGMKWPVIVKPNAEGSSIGVFDKNVVGDEQGLEARIKEMYGQGFAGQLLVEEYIDGRELTVAVWGNEKLEILPIIEQKFDFLPAGMRRIASFELKWLYEDTLKDPKTAYECPANLNERLKDEIEKMTKLVYRALEVRDCARVDFRLDRDERPYFLEINTLPGINPDQKVISYFPLAVRAAGIDFAALVKRIIELASARYNLGVR